MTMTYADHVKQLITRFPQCEWHVAEALTWQAAILVYNEHPWSFCVKEDRIVTEAVYNTGTVNIANGSTAVTLAGGTWDPAWVNRRFIGQGRNEEYFLTITGAASATLANNWLGDTNAAATYSIYRDTYSVPADCNYGREYFVLDPSRNRFLRFKDLGVFMRIKSNYLFSNFAGYPVWVTRVATDGSNVPQLRFGPDPPNTIENYPIIYFAAPQRTTISSPITPLIPAQFEDLVWRRSRWLYAEERGKSYGERNDLRRIYYDRFGEAVRACDGGAEVERYISSNYPASYADWYSEWSSHINVSYTGS